VLCSNRPLRAALSVNRAALTNDNRQPPSTDRVARTSDRPHSGERATDGANLSIPRNNDLVQFLADHTNGRAYATVLRLWSVCLSVCRRPSVRNEMWLNGAS